MYGLTLNYYYFIFLPFNRPSVSKGEFVFSALSYSSQGVQVLNISVEIIIETLGTFTVRLFCFVFGYCYKAMRFNCARRSEVALHTA